MENTLEAGTPPTLDRLELADVVDLALWAGTLLMHSGAESERVEETVHRIGTALGANWLDILVSPNVLIITTSSVDGEFRTKVRRISSLAVRLDIVDAVNDLSRRIEVERLDRAQVRAAMEQIARLQPYNHWLVALMVGAACAALSWMVGGDEIVFVVTFVAATAAQVVRLIMQRRSYNVFLTTVAAATVAAFIASTAALWNLSPRGQVAISSAVLLLVPGVHLINAAEDIIKGHMLTGLTRGFIGAIITLAIAIGITLALGLLQVPVTL
ncbi:MAG: threonine/serine exporter family protein [Anaerolineae bacterium]|nr:threonine/serine exporter family protein [Anaerolineae bacterium]